MSVVVSMLALVILFVASRSVSMLTSHVARDYFHVKIMFVVKSLVNYVCCVVAFIDFIAQSDDVVVFYWCASG